MPLSPLAVTFDCENAQNLASFWSTVTARPVDPGASPDFASIGSPGFDDVDAPVDPTKLTLMFLRVPEGKTAKNRCHVDFGSTQRGAEVLRLVELGATHVGDKEEHGFQWSVLQDPEGNEFCICDLPADA